MEKSLTTPSFYVSAGVDDDGWEHLESRPGTAGPWSAEAQHGGPPAALLGRAVEGVAAACPVVGPVVGPVVETVVDTVVGRFTMELLGPVPVGPLRVRAEVLRPGRSVSLVGAELVDAGRDRVVATARAWLLPATDTGPGSADGPPGHSHHDGVRRERGEGWLGGYVDAVDWRWIRGGLDQPGTGVVWMRPPNLVEGEELSPTQRLLACVDSASGVSAALDIREWSFLNTELTVHLLRPPVGEWVCLDAVTEVGPGAVGVATSRIHDELGPVGRSAQTLLVVPRG